MCPVSVSGLAAFAELVVFSSRTTVCPRSGTNVNVNVVFTPTAIRIYFASLTLICELLFIHGISWETKMLILNSQMLAFFGTLFILAIKIFIS